MTPPDRRRQRGQRILDALCAQDGLAPRLFIHGVSRLATAGVLEGGALLASTDLLDILDDRELRAVLAHEIGHIRLGTAGPGDHHRSQKAELAADAYAVRLTGDPEALISALMAIDRHNQRKEGVVAGGRGLDHPSVTARIREIHRLAREIGLEARGLRRVTAAIGHAVAGL